MSVCPLDLAKSMGLEPCKTKLVYTRTLHHSNVKICCFRSCNCYTCQHSIAGVLNLYPALYFSGGLPHNEGVMQLKNR